MSVTDVAPAVKILTKQLEEARAAKERAHSQSIWEWAEYRRLSAEADARRISYDDSTADQKKHEAAAVELEKAIFALTGAEPQW